MSEKNKIRAFKELRATLLDEFRQMEAELEKKREELRELGILNGDGKGAAKVSGRTTRVTAAAKKEKPASRGKKRKARVNVTDQDVLNAIGKSEMSATELQKELGCVYQTAFNKLKSLLKAKKLTSRKQGTKVLYKSA